MASSRGTVQNERGPRGTALTVSCEQLRVRLLGGFQVSVGPRTIEESEWRLRKAARLVKLLALAPNHRMHRDEAMHLLWPKLDTKAAAIICATRSTMPAELSNLYRLPLSATYISRVSCSPCTRLGRSGSTQRLSKMLQSRPAVRAGWRRMRQRSRCTSETSCRRIVTKCGQKADGRSCGGRTLTCFSSWPNSTRIVKSLNWPSKHCGV